MKLAPVKTCTGCTACAAICPHAAIVMCPDDEGFLHPQIDATKCVACGMCRRVCPALNKLESLPILKAYSSKTRDDALRMKSSSGGAFSALAECVLKRGGVVFGAAFDRDWSVFHTAVEKVGDLDILRRSKYVQSDLRNALNDLWRALNDGRETMFVGTPCQVAGVWQFLSIRPPCDDWRSHLLLVDLICHGAPSPNVWRQYLDWQRTRHHSEINSVSFRDKRNGWRKYSLSLRFSDGSEYLSENEGDPYMRGFISGLYFRPSCSSGLCRSNRSHADITLGDSWPIGFWHPEFDDDKGLSTVLIKSEYGLHCWQVASANLDMVELDAKEYVSQCNELTRPSRHNPRRREFFSGLGKREFVELIDSVFAPTVKHKIQSAIFRFRGMIWR